MHNLHVNERTGKHSFFSVYQKAWHGLGTIVTEYPTSREAIRFAGLDYEVEKLTLFTYDTGNHDAAEETGIKIPEIVVPNYYATVRTDTAGVLGVVGKEYEVVQNRDAFSFFDAIVEGNGIQYETAGVLGKGSAFLSRPSCPAILRSARLIGLSSTCF